VNIIEFICFALFSGIIIFYYHKTLVVVDQMDDKLHDVAAQCSYHERKIDELYAKVKTLENASCTPKFKSTATEKPDVV